MVFESLVVLDGEPSRIFEGGGCFGGLPLPRTFPVVFLAIWITPCFHWAWGLRDLFVADFPLLADVELPLEPSLVAFRVRRQRPSLPRPAHRLSVPRSFEVLSISTGRGTQDAHPPNLVGPWDK